MRRPAAEAATDRTQGRGSSISCAGTSAPSSSTASTRWWCSALSTRADAGPSSVSRSSGCARGLTERGDRHRAHGSGARSGRRPGLRHLRMAPARSGGRSRPRSRIHWPGASSPASCRIGGRCESTGTGMRSHVRVERRRRARRRVDDERADCRPGGGLAPIGAVGYLCSMRTNAPRRRHPSRGRRPGYGVENEGTGRQVGQRREDEERVWSG